MSQITPAAKMGIPSAAVSPVTGLPAPRGPAGAPGAGSGHDGVDPPTSPAAGDGAPGPCARWTKADDARLIDRYYAMLPWGVIGLPLGRTRPECEDRFYWLRERDGLPLRGDIPVPPGYPRTEAEMARRIVALGGYQNVPHKPFNHAAALVNTMRLRRALTPTFSPTSCAALCAQAGATARG